METHQYFGVPLANIEAARSHEIVGQHRFNTNVPTRSEVAMLSPENLRLALTQWMNHSATEIIPSKAQIGEVLMVIESRQDYKDLTYIAEMCKHYILGD